MRDFEDVGDNGDRRRAGRYCRMSLSEELTARCDEHLAQLLEVYPSGFGELPIPAESIGRRYRAFPTPLSIVGSPAASCAGEA